MEEIPDSFVDSEMLAWEAFGTLSLNEFDKRHAAIISPGTFSYVNLFSTTWSCE